MADAITNYRVIRAKRDRLIGQLGNYPLHHRRRTMLLKSLRALDEETSRAIQAMKAEEYASVFGNKRPAVAKNAAEIVEGWIREAHA